MSGPELTQVDQDRWQLDAPWTRYGITVPAGFVTDLASIPRVLWALPGFAPFELLSGPILHDYLYRTRMVPRAEADALLYRAMREDGIGRVRAYTVYSAVRMFGWISRATEPSTRLPQGTP
jgi:hypothetical protein